ncbi:zinc finger protein 691 isoform X2 [Esox lucius]|uniref:zinc finger protein 691 isoform X2 n=1 Tax=Esox lucius TaxID=8010 RepID=UPI00057730FF|nr:zinc finger protein 691 isoform X2 [Esox lucius]
MPYKLLQWVFAQVIQSPTMDSDILNIEEIVMGRGPPDPPAELITEKPVEPYKPISSFKAPPPPTIQPYQHENLQCFQCFITFCNSKAKERHMKKSHREEYKQQLQQGDTLFTCYVCDRTFPSSEELTQHQGSHNKEDKPFKCPHCQESFRTFSELTTHRRQVCPERVFQCKDCTETFRSPALLRTHRLALHPRPAQLPRAEAERQFMCKDCNETFRTPALFRTHRLAQHPLSEAEAEEPDDPTKTHRCGKCNRGFEMESELVMHQENHAGDQHCNGSASPAKKRGRPAKAEDTMVGEKKGKRRKKKDEGDGAEEAETVNSTEEAADAPAEVKGKAAGSGGRRGRPKGATGKEAKPHQTEASVEEKKPKAAVTAPKQHPCTECELTFPALAQLRVHKKEKHAPRKAHPCEECEESFARPEQLEAHKNRAHTKGRYACPTCGKSFGRESNLKAHQQSSHQEEEEKKEEVAGRSRR